jgi:hypothetical protein
VFLESAVVNGLIAPIVAVSLILQETFVAVGFPQTIQNFLAPLATDAWIAILITMVVVLIAGCVLESIPNVIIFAPILAPLAAHTGVNPIHFAMIFCVGDAIGFITPPYGLNLYVTAGITGYPYMQIAMRGVAVPRRAAGGLGAGSLLPVAEPRPALKAEMDKPGIERANQGRVVRAAAIQAAPVFLDKRSTIEKYAGLIETAGREGAQLIVTPETGIPGYPYWRANFGFTDAASAQDWRDTVMAYHRESVSIERDFGASAEGGAGSRRPLRRRNIREGRAPRQ